MMYHQNTYSSPNTNDFSNILTVSETMLSFVIRVQKTKNDIIKDTKIDRYKDTKWFIANIYIVTSHYTKCFT